MIRDNRTTMVSRQPATITRFRSYSMIFPWMNGNDPTINQISRKESDIHDPDPVNAMARHRAGLSRGLAAYRLGVQAVLTR